MLFPQKAIGLIGKEFKLTILAPEKIEIEVIGCPASITPVDVKSKGRGKICLRFRAVGLSYQPKLIKFKVTELASGQVHIIDVMSRVFGTKEFFVCLVQSSNIHYGWNPEPTEQYFRTDDSELVLYKDEQMGNDAFIHALTLEKIFHKYGAPITWLIDDIVAHKAAISLKQWHWKYGDDYGLLPRSYFYHNCRNYNIDLSAEQTTEIIQVLRDHCQEIFREVGYPFYTRTMGVDQWVGSVGTNFLAAARNLGLEAVWGIGYDHRSCDTSMFHRGAPWDAYKPHQGNFRVPGGKIDQWLFQWTTRDILNTSYFSPNGATIFSTDADDICANAIPKYQDDYYARLLHEYKKNLAHNEFGVFLVHQEDHDSHIQQSNTVLEHFIDQTFDNNLFTTIEETVAWLNLKYSPEEHPYQVLEIDDALTCHARLKLASQNGNSSPLFAAHPEWGHEPNPKHVAYYGTDAMWIARFPQRIPIIYYDYQHSPEYEFRENGEYPSESLPEMRILEEKWRTIQKKRKLFLKIESSGNAKNLPLLFWKPRKAFPHGKFMVEEAASGPATAFGLKNALVINLNRVEKGENAYIFVFQG
ncbi:hypothetical protein JXJ21_08275 [candidate division KSB1 bacterium]|nr:hypothetical protein [candidate division KSB1 bacterium]